MSAGIVLESPFAMPANWGRLIVHFRPKLDLEIGGGWTILEAASFVPVTKRVPHEEEEEHGRKLVSLLRGNAYAAGHLAGGG